MSEIWGLPRYGYSLEMSKKLDALHAEAKKELRRDGEIRRDLLSACKTLLAAFNSPGYARNGVDREIVEAAGIAIVRAEAG